MYRTDLHFVAAHDRPICGFFRRRCICRFGVGYIRLGEHVHRFIIIFFEDGAHELFSRNAFAQFGIIKESIRRSRVYDSPFFHCDDIVRLSDRFRMVRDVNDGMSLADPIRKEREDIASRSRVEHGKRFVENEYIRINRDNTGERFFLRLPERQRHGRRRGFVQQSDNGKRLNRTKFDFIG